MRLTRGFFDKEMKGKREKGQNDGGKGNNGHTLTRHYSGRQSERSRHSNINVGKIRSKRKKSLTIL